MNWKKVIQEIQEPHTARLFCIHGTNTLAFAEFRALSEELKKTAVTGSSHRRDEILLMTSRAQYIQKHQHEGLFFQQRYQASLKDAGETVRHRLEARAHSDPSTSLSDWIAAFELEDIYDKPLLQLSSGEWQRYAVCEALLMKPRILLIPELLKGLDQYWQQRILDLLIEKTESTDKVIFTADRSTHHPGVYDLPLDRGLSTEIVGELKMLSSRVAEDFTAYHARFLPENSTEPLLEMEGVHIRYGSKTILQDIHWTVRAGEKWNIQGANGAGKSTLISLVNSDNPQGYSQPIKLFGAPYGRSSIWDRKARIAYFGSDFFQYFRSSKTIEQVLHQQLKTPYLDTTQPPASLVQGLMDYFGLWEYREMPYPTADPSVKRQTLLLANYLKSSDILVLDEPYQDLRQIQIQKNNHFLEKVQISSRQTVVFVTHRADHKPGFVDQILKLDKGRIVI